MRDQLDLKQIEADLQRQTQQRIRINRGLRYVFWGLFIVGVIGPYLLLPGLFLLPQLPFSILQSVADVLERLSGVFGVLGYAIPVAILILLLNGLVNVSLSIRRERARARRANAVLPALSKLIPDLPTRIPTPIPVFDLLFILLPFVSLFVLWTRDEFALFVVITLVVVGTVVWRIFYWRWEARWLYHGPLDIADYKGATKRVNTALRLFPRHIRFRSTAGFVRFLSGEEFESYYRELLRSRLSPYYFSIFLSTVGRAWLEEGRQNDAFLLLESAVRISPDDPGLYPSLAAYYLETKSELDRAQELLEHTMAYFPKPSTNLYLQRYTWSSYKALEAQIAALLNNNIRANAALDVALETADPLFIPGMAIVCLQAGHVRQIQGDTAAAREYFTRAQHFDPRGRSGKEAAEELAKLDTEHPA